MPPPNLAALGSELDAVDGTVSVWCGHVGAKPAYTRRPDAPHYAASTMKVAVMAAAYRLADAGRLDIDAEVEVHDEFASATAGMYRNSIDYDNDPQPWARLGDTAGLRWLIRRMIVKSSNLATNLVLEQVWLADQDAVAVAWREAGATTSRTARGIEDYPARDAGLDNIVTAADLAALLAAIRRQRIAAADTCAEMLDVLLAQEVTDDVVQGLPPGTPVAHKNGWVDGINHSAALVLPDDAPEFILATCSTTTFPGTAGKQMLARAAAAAWADRRDLGTG